MNEMARLNRMIDHTRSIELSSIATSMNTQTYPGKSLSLSQLVFALNEELKRTAFSPLYVAGVFGIMRNDIYTDFLCSVTLDQVSQLDHDTTAALATIHEWKNSLAPINRLPLDILSLIPTHFSAQEDLLRASFVCRHWRRTFLQCAKLWSELFPAKGEVYVKTLLERSKQSQLTIWIGGNVPVSTMILLSSRTNRIWDLGFVDCGWAAIQEFVDINPGPFPLLNSLTFNITAGGPLDDSNAIVPPSTRLFSTAVNLREFCFYLGSSWSPPLSRFSFPNLVEFRFLVQQGRGGFPTLQLLNFLEASPMLQVVSIHFMVDLSLNGVPRERVVVLPKVEDLRIIVVESTPGYNLMTHLSCPSIMSASFTLEADPDTNITPPEGIFPSPALWNVIVQQYTRSPLVDITLLQDNDVACRIVLRSSDTAIIELCIDIATNDETKDEIYQGVFTQAINATSNHPQISNVRHFRLCHNYDYPVSACVPHIANEAGRLFKTLRPLDGLTIYNCDIQPYSRFFLSILEGHVDESVVIPPIKELTILYPMYSSEQEFMVAIVGLAWSRYVLGVPFESVIIQMAKVPAGVEEALTPWVDNVECCNL